MKKLLKNNSGFTLLELIVALLIVAILFAGVFEIFRFSVLTNKNINVGMDYTHFAQGLMEEYRSLPFTVLMDEVQKSAGNPKRYIPVILDEEQLPGFKGEVIITDVTASGKERLEIVVKVAPESNPSKIYKLVYIKTKY